jgi:sugar O-acyltransferase (sialic acid O-acetyltransferase NeuD family)
VSRGIYVAGTRTFAAEVVDFVRDAGMRPLGLLEPDDPDRVGTTIHGLPVSWLDDGPPGEAAQVIVGTGDSDREGITSRLGAASFEFAVLVHPHAHVAPTAEVGAGALIGPGAVVGARASVGRHAVLGRGVLVGHHTEVAELATLGPGANVAGNVRLGRKAFVGMGATVRDHVTVGEGVVVAMGAVVVGSVAPGTQVRGLPAVPYP